MMFWMGLSLQLIILSAEFGCISKGETAADGSMADACGADGHKVIAGILRGRGYIQPFAAQAETSSKFQ